MVIEGVYIVPKDSRLQTVDDIDHTGIRVAVAQGSAYDLFLTRALTKATLVRKPSGPESLDMFVDDKLEAATDALVEELRGFSPLAQRTAKALLNQTEDTSLQAAIELEGHCYSRLRQSDDFREGVEAFQQKRKAVFRGT